MARDITYEHQLFDAIKQLGRHWIKCIKHPSKKAIKKHPILDDAYTYVCQQTPCLNDPLFDYSLTTRLVWLRDNLSGFPKCKCCGSPISNWNVPSLSDSYKQTCSKKCERQLAQQQARQHFISAYGVTNAFQLDYVKTKTEEQKHEWLEKCYQTRKANHTFKTSKPEDEAYKLLKEKFSDVIRQYRSAEYPFFCDFYILSLDLYIECNYSWTHGGRPYVADDPVCQQQLAEWQAKGTAYYKNAIETWTIRDVRKREIGRKLNWKEFWTIEEMKEWINFSSFTK